MANILTISKDENFLNKIKGMLDDYAFKNCCLKYEDEAGAVDFVKKGEFNIVILDDVENFSILAKKIKNLKTENNIFIALLYNADSINSINEDYTGFIDSFIQKPVLKNIVISTINSISKVQNKIEKYKEDNKELNKSLYQLDVLYNTSSKLSGNLDKEKLYDIMFETLEKTLSYDVCTALLYDKPKNKLIIHSLKKLTPDIQNVLREKIVLFAKENIGQNTNFNDITIEEHIKPSYDNQIFDIKLLNFDRLEAPLKVKDTNFGVILLYRQKPFTKEDVVCFQSVVHQIANPLRTIILYNEIKNTNVELKKLERIKSEFVSIVSHELRTPLTPINNSLEIVLSEQTGPLSDKAKNFINMAKRNVSRLSGIIEDLLDLSRMQTGKFDFKFKKYNVKNSLDLVQKTFEGQAKEKNLEFKVNFDENLPEIYADAHRIDQILSNLVTNATKFTPQGGKIEVCAKTLSKEELDPALFINPVKISFENYLMITVKDTGIGIKQEDIEKIFDKFSQIENSLTRNAGGIGLGLTITKHFIDAHLGLIFVQSKENEGSSFNVLIPIYSNYTAFEINLNSAIKKGDVDLISISSNSNFGAEEFLEELKTNNIIKPLKNSEEFFSSENGFIYKIYFPNMQTGAFNFTISKLKEFINGPKYKDCGILLEDTSYKKEEDSITGEEI